MNVRFINSETFQFNDIDYWISVYEEEKGYVALWECEQCKEQMRLPKILATIELATAECKESAIHHQAIFHATDKKGWRADAAYSFGALRKSPQPMGQVPIAGSARRQSRRQAI
jgi:hypothetical protein